MSYTFFTDRDLGRALPASLEEAGLKVEPHDRHFGPTTPDEEWLAQAGANGWYVLTHDKRIRYKPNERDALMTAGVGMFLLAGKAAHAALARNFIATRSAVERFIEKHDRPFIAKVYRPNGVEDEDLGSRSGRVEMWLTHEEWLGQ